MEKTKKKKVIGVLKVVIPIVLALMLVALPLIIMRIKENREWRENWWQHLSECTIEIYTNSMPEPFFAEKLDVCARNKDNVIGIRCTQDKFTKIEAVINTLSYDVKIIYGGKEFAYYKDAPHKTAEAYVRDLGHTSPTINGKSWSEMKVGLYKNTEDDSSIPFLTISLKVAYLDELLTGCVFLD